MKIPARYLPIIFLSSLTLIVSATADAAGVKLASGDFNATHGSGCINTEVHIYARNGKIQKTKVRVAVHVDISQFDNCNDQLIFSLSGATAVSDEEFQVGETLDVANLDVMGIRLIDSVSNKTIPLEIDLTWEGFGGTSESDARSYFNQPGDLVRLPSRHRSMWRSARVSGIILVGGTRIPLEPSEYAAISIIR